MMRKLLSIFTAVVLYMSLTACWDTGEDKDKVSSLTQYVSYFPDKVGTEWIYNGFAEYGHTVKLDKIENTADGKVEYTINGKVADMSGGEAKGDFNVSLRYIFSGDNVKEVVVKGEKLPHKIKELIVLKEPISKGNTWTQKAAIDGVNTQINAEILEIKENDQDGKTIKVQYTGDVEHMPGGVYREVRVFKEKTGLISFENTFNRDIEFNYSLFHFN